MLDKHGRCVVCSASLEFGVLDIQYNCGQAADDGGYTQCDGYVMMTWIIIFWCFRCPFSICTI